MKKITWNFRKIGIIQGPPEKAETDSEMCEGSKVTHVVLQPGGLLVSVLRSPLGGGATTKILLSEKSDKSKKL